MQTLAYGMMAFAALLALTALAPAASADPIDAAQCTPSPFPQHPLPVYCVSAHSDPTNHCVLRFTVTGEDIVRGGQALCFS